MAYEKHVGIYTTVEDLTADISALVSPWVAYVGPKEDGGFDVYYSNMTNLNSNNLNIAEELNRRVTKLENSVVTLTEEQYEKLIQLEQGAKMLVTNVDGNEVEITYDPSVYYYTYDPADLPNKEE
jgi:hypothetical protein